MSLRHLAAITFDAGKLKPKYLFKKLFVLKKSKIFIQNKYYFFLKFRVFIQKNFIFSKSRIFIQTKYSFF